jgi:hypothetical protein
LNLLYVISWGKGEGEKLKGRKGVGRKKEEMRESEGYRKLNENKSWWHNNSWQIIKYLFMKRSIR